MARRYSVTLTAPAGDLGRRERKKRQTRDALLDAARILFERKGFEATTIEEIAEQVDVSSRTFFRYFASKEDVFFHSGAEVAVSAQNRLFNKIVAAVQTRPADEPVLTALRRACVEVLESGGPGVDARLIGQFVNLLPMQTTPADEHARHKQSVLAAAIAGRMDVDVRTDLRPHLASALTGCAFRSAEHLMDRSPHHYPTLAKAVDEAFHLIETGFDTLTT